MYGRNPSMPRLVRASMLLITLASSTAGIAGCQHRPNMRVLTNLAFEGVALVRENGQVVVLRDATRLGELQAALKLTPDELSVLVEYERWRESLPDESEGKLCLWTKDRCVPVSPCGLCREILLYVQAGNVEMVESREAIDRVLSTTPPPVVMDCQCY